MRKWIYLATAAGLVVGTLAGYSFEHHQMVRANDQRLNAQLAQLASYLNLAQIDLREATSNPTTPQEQAYEVNYKVAVAQASAIWGSLSAALIPNGFSAANVELIRTGLNVIHWNILPPNGMSPTSPTVRRAHAWIALLQKTVSIPNGLGKANYLAHLRTHIGPVVHTYESYRSDGNFQVPPE